MRRQGISVLLHERRSRFQSLRMGLDTADARGDRVGCGARSSAHPASGLPRALGAGTVSAGSAAVSRGTHRLGPRRCDVFEEVGMRKSEMSSGGFRAGFFDPRPFDVPGRRVR